MNEELDKILKENEELKKEIVILISIFNIHLIKKLLKIWLLIIMI